MAQMLKSVLPFLNFLFYTRVKAINGLPRWHSCKESACNAGDPSSISGSGRSPGGGNGNPLHYSCLENPTEKPSGLQPIVSQRVGHNWATERAHTSPFIKSYKSLLKQGLCLTFLGYLGNVHTSILHAIGR